MRDLLAHAWGVVLLRGVFGIVFGVMALVWPGITLVALVFLWGAYAVVDAIAAFAMAFSGKEGRGWLVFSGVVGLIAGVAAFAWPGVTAVVLLVLIACWAILIGVSYAMAAWNLRGLHAGSWLLALTGAASAALGIVMLAWPETSAVAMVAVIGAMAVIWGGLTLALGLRLRSADRRPPEAPYDAAQLA